MGITPPSPPTLGCAPLGPPARWICAGRRALALEPATSAGHGAHYLLYISGAVAIKNIALGAAFSLALGTANTDSDYRQQVERWRAQHQEKLAADDGWLTVAGLDWFKEGENRVGADPASEVPLPDHSLPGRVATISFHAGQAVLHPATGVPLTL